MPKKRTAPTKKTAAKKAAPELLFEDGSWWVVSGTTRVNVGRNKRYAENYMAENFS